MKTPPVDLLVWFTPQKDCRLQVVDRMTFDIRTADCPSQLRYTWEGTPQKGYQRVFTQVYYPHAPYRFRSKNNNPGGAKEKFDDPIRYAAYASCISVLRDDPSASVIRCEFEPGRVENVVFNPEKQSINLGEIETNDTFVYIDVVSTAKKKE